MITSSIRFTIAGQISMCILSFCSSRNWSQQKPDLFRLCDYSRWSCMHGLQVNLVSGMAQANDTKGGTNESFVGGETVVLPGTFSNLPEKTNLEWNPRTVYCWVFAAWNEFIVCRQTGDGFLLVRGFCLKLHHGCCVQFVCSIITVVYPPGRKQNDPDLKNDMVFMVLCFLW